MSRISSTFKKSRGANSSQKGILRERSPSPLRSGSPTMRRSRSRTRSTSVNRSLNDLEGIESDYIKNLQQQIYFLEIEANYLREQARKATDMHPKMTAEAERMLNKLRQMQSNIDSLSLELRRKESSLDLVHTEKERTAVKLQEEEVSRAREKHLLMDEIMELKKQKDLVSLESARRQTQLEATRDERDRLALQFKSSEDKLDLARSQLDQRIDQHKRTQLALDEKRAELVSTEAALKETEDRFYNSTILLKDRTVNDLRAEVRMLRERLTDSEVRVGDERALRGKVQDDTAHLMTDNSLLNQRITELESQLSRERALRETADLKRSTDLAELTTLSEREKVLEFDLRQTRDQLLVEKDRCQRYMEQLAKEGDIKSNLKLTNTAAHKRLADAEGLSLTLRAERESLRKDKNLLIDHIGDLQKQLTQKDDEILNMRSRLRSLGVHLSNVEREREIGETIQSQKWHDFENLADSMRSLSRSMARSTSPVSPRSTRSPRSARLLDA